jgi:hypothetical protein
MALLATGASSAAVDLNSDDFFSLWSFLTISYDELNALTFSKSLVTRALNCTEMCKYVRAASRSIKPKPLFSLNHFTVPVIFSDIFVT